MNGANGSTNGASNGNGHAAHAAASRVKTVNFSSKRPDLTLLYLDNAAASSSSPKPLVFYIHGGGFVAGDAYLIPAHLVALAQNIGAALVSVNYRLCPEVGIRNGVEDVEEAWQFVFKGGLGQTYEPSRTLLVGASAGSHYAVQLLLNMEAPAPRPAAFLNIYGAVVIDANKYKAPIPKSIFPHPLLDMPGGFPPFNELIQRIYKRPEGMTSDNVVEWPQGVSLKAGLEQPSETRLGLLDESLNKGKHTAEGAWQQFWKSNGLSDELFTDLQLGVRMKPEEIARNLLLPWGFRTGNFVDMLRDSEGGQTPEELDEYVNVAKRLQGAEANAKLVPTISVHGADDVLVPASVSQGLDALMKSRGEESELVIVEGKEHGFDCGDWVYGQGEDIKRVDKWVREKLGVAVAA